MRAPAARGSRGLLGGILLLALILRVSGNLYDMGYGLHPDEHHFRDRALTMARSGTLNPAYFHNPPLYTYTILLSLYALFGIEFTMGRVASPAEFVSVLPPTVSFALARGLSALAGTATCFVLYLLGRRFGGDLVGLVAAGFYAVSFLSVRDAHFAVNDIPMVSLVTLTFLFALQLLESGRSRDLVLGGLTAGLAAATKYNGGIAFLPLLLACGLGHHGQERSIGTGRAARIGVRWLSLLLLGIAGFLIGNPYALLDPPAFLAGLAAQFDLRGKMWRGQSDAPVPILALESLVIELGWPLLLFLVFATGVCLSRGGARARATLLALSVVIPVILYHSSQALFFSRFLLPCTPFVALIAAWGLFGLRETSHIPWARRPIVLWAGVALLIASPLARTVYLDVLLHRPDTRIVAKEYLERVAPAGSAIVLEGNDYYPTYTPPLDPSRFKLMSVGSDPSLLHPGIGPAEQHDYYLFSSFVTGRVPGILEAEERSLIALLERYGFARVMLSPLRDDGDLPFEPDLVYLPYRHLFQYERPGPAILIYGRPGVPLPPLSQSLSGGANPKGSVLPMRVVWRSMTTGRLTGRRT